jgi:hypothetical protein
MSAALFDVFLKARCALHAGTSLSIQFYILLDVVKLPIHTFDLFLPLSWVYFTFQDLIIYLFSAIILDILIILTIVRIEEVDLSFFSPTVLHSVLFRDQGTREPDVVNVSDQVASLPDLNLAPAPIEHDD